MSQLREVFAGNLPVELVEESKLNYWEKVFLFDMKQSNGFIVEENGKRVHYSFHPEEKEKHLNGHNGRLFVIQLRVPYENISEDAIVTSNNVFCQGEIDAEWLWLFEEYENSEFMDVPFKERIRQEMAAFN